MRDDFVALDLLSPGGLTGSKRAKKKLKALFGLPRRQGKGKAKRALTTLLPQLASKVKQRRPATLQGWPVALSWPDSDSKEIH